MSQSALHASSRITNAIPEGPLIRIRARSDIRDYSISGEDHGLNRSRGDRYISDTSEDVFKTFENDGQFSYVGTHIGPLTLPDFALEQPPNQEISGADAPSWVDKISERHLQPWIPAVAKSASSHDILVHWRHQPPSSLNNNYVESV